MPFYLGIDAGGTKTESAISNGAELLGQTTCASCKASGVGESEARHNLREAVVRVCEAARIKPQEIQRVCIGIAGASLPGTVEFVRSVIGELAAAEVNVTGDHIIAHRAAFGTMAGVLVVAGTGSIVYGRNEKGETARAGGWGPMISDEGSALWIGREAVAAALRVRDAGNNNGLLSTIAAYWQVTPEEVIRIGNACVQQRLSELAGPVNKAAEKGDAAAQSVTDRAGKELAVLAEMVIARLWPENVAVRVAMAGGVLQGSSLVRKAFHDALQAARSNATISFAYVRPVMGALAIAAEQRALQ